MYLEMMPSGSTPAAENSVSPDRPPLMQPVEHEPERPGKGDPIRIRAVVTDPEPAAAMDGRPALEVRLDSMVGGSQAFSTMLDDGSMASGDEKAGDGIFTATLGPFPEGTLVPYRVQASSPDGRLLKSTRQADAST